MDRLNEAIMFATAKHSTQFRKGTTIPYIVHPIEVMQILKDNGATEDMLIAGVLHDTIEDTDATYEEILNRFGENVANMVMAESEIKGIPYRERKYEHMMRVKDASKEAKMVNCADKLSNLRSIYLDLKTSGEATWNKFNASEEDICWYYRLAIEAFEEIKGTKMYKEFTIFYSKVFGERQVQNQAPKSPAMQYYDIYYKEDLPINVNRFNGQQKS